MADAQLSVSLSADITAFRNALQQASQAASSTSGAVSVLSANISTNVANINRVNLNAFNRSLQAGTLSLRQFSNTAVAPTGGLVNLTRGSNQAANALTNLGRVAQDAPFGFIGIQNNLNPLLESFQRLRAETGSNKAALAALGSSLMGPAGLGIAFSVVGAAILFYNQYQQKAAKETANSEAAMKRAKKSADEYALSLDDVTRSRLIGAQNAQKDITDLKILYGITQDVAASSKQRAQAVDQLQKQYPEYFKNIKDETILSGGAKESYDRLTQSIIATARARAAEDIITKNSSRQLENQQKINDAAIAYTKANEKLVALDKKRSSLGAAGGTSELSGVTSKIDKERAKAADQLNESAKILREAKVDNNILDEKNLALTKEITNQVNNKGADLAGGVGDLPITKKVKTLSDILKELQVDLKQTATEANLTLDERAKKNIDDYTKAINALIKIGYAPASDEIVKLKKAQNELFDENVKRKADVFFNSVLPGRLAEKARADVEAAKKELQDRLPEFIDTYEKFTNPSAIDQINKKSFVDNFGLDPASLRANEIKEALDLLSKSFDQGGISLDGFKEKYNLLSNALKTADLGKQINDIAVSFIGSGIGDAFASIGTALSTGGDAIAAFGNSILQSMAGFLGRLGDLLIEYGAAALLKAKLDLSLAIPGAALVTAPAAIAAGVALKLISGAFSGLVNNKSKTDTSSSSSGVKQIPQFATGVNNFSGGLAMVGERGPELVNLPTGASVIPNTRTRNIMAASQNSNVVINGDFEIGLDKLYLRLQQTGKRLGRLG